MGHLCSCHRDNAAKFDRGAGGRSAWRTDSSLINKLRYLSGGMSPYQPCSLPPRELPPLNDGEQPACSVDTHVVVERALSASSPSSPVLPRAAELAPPKPPRMRSMLVDGRDADTAAADWKQLSWTSAELELGAVRDDDVTLSTSLGTLVVGGVGGLDTASSVRGGGTRRHTAGGGTTSSLLRLACQLLASCAAVQPELLVDLLRPGGVVGDETAAAVRRCAARRRAACEIVAEVVVSRDEVAALCEALRATGCGQVADCLAAVDSMLQLIDSSQVEHAASEEESRECRGCGTTTDETQSGNSRLRGCVDVDVVYVDPLTGCTVRSDTEDDVMSEARVNCLRHRSPFIDSETISLPPQPLESVASPDVDRTVGVPVASATFHCVCLSDRIADRLADVLLRHRSFRILTFIKCHRVDACLLRCRRILEHRKCDVARSKLSRMNFRLSRVEDVNVVTDLAEVMSYSLRALSLTGCGITSTGCAAVVRSLVTASRCLSELDVGFNDVVDVAALSEALAANCCLRSLWLRGNAIGSVAAAALFSSLRRNYRLELLDVSGNPIGERQKTSCGGDGDDVWRQLAEALLSNRTLRQLKMERCSLGVDACLALGRALAANTTLQVIDISMNQSVGDVGVHLLADGLRRNQRHGVRTLALNMCAVGNLGFRSLLVAIKESGGATHLRHIKLCYNLVGCSDRPRRHGRPDATSGGKAKSPGPRPTSAHLELPTPDALSLSRLSDRSADSGIDGKYTETAPSLTPIRKQDNSAANYCPVSGIVTYQNLFIENSNQTSQVTLTENVNVLDCDGVNSDSTASGAKFNHAKHRPTLESTVTTCRQMRTVPDGAYDWSAVKEPSELTDAVPAANSRPGLLDRSASSVLGTDDCEVTTPDLSELPSSSTDTDCDAKDDDEPNIYALLCQVLRANPQLKVLLWGNQGWHSAGEVISRTIELAGDSSATPGSRSVVETRSDGIQDRSVRGCATLPRNYEFATYRVESNVHCSSKPHA